MPFGVEFSEYSPHSAFDPTPYLRDVPETATIRGLFFHSIRDQYTRRSVASPAMPKIPFSMYSRAQYNQVMLTAARDLFPNLSVVEGLHSIGRCVYPAFYESMIGKAIFAIAGKDFPKMVQLAPRAYAASVNPGEVIVRRADEGSVHIEVVDVWDLPPVTCGVWRGGMDVCGLIPKSFQHRVPRPGQHELRITW